MTKNPAARKAIQIEKARASPGPPNAKATQLANNENSVDKNDWNNL